MPTEGRITPLPQDHPFLIDAVRAMRRSQAWAVVAVDREITVGVEAPQINFAGQLPRVSLIAQTAPDNLEYTIAFFQCVQQVVERYLEMLKKQRGEGENNE